MDSSKRRCEAFTAGGDPCRAWAVRDSVRPLCSAHLRRNVGAGAVVGNENALVHGFYGRHYQELELVDLVNLGTDKGLIDEIALARVQLRRVVARLEEVELDTAEFIELTDLVFRGLGRVGRLVMEQERLGGGGLDDLMGDVLDVLGIEFGIKL